MASNWVTVTALAYYAMEWARGKFQRKKVEVLDLKDCSQKRYYGRTCSHHRFPGFVVGGVLGNAIQALGEDS